jgi:putative ABC transport system ATP-binding protein
VTPCIQAEGLSKWFGEDEARTWAVREVSFEAFFHEMLFIVGPSGSGKTTLLSMLSGILRPNGGRVRVESTDVWTLGEDALADFRLHTVGFVFQDYHLFPRLTTVENVALPLILKRIGWEEAMVEAEHYLDVVGLKDRAQVRPSKLSGGEQQRVAIARAVVSRPDLLIFDEPTASLDGETGRKIIDFVRREMLDDKRCILIVTHDDRIYSFADRILRMEDGRIVGIEDRRA